MRYVSCLDEHWVEVHYKAQAECKDLNVNTNTFVAAFTTCWARLHLYEALERLGKRVLYFDTDSVLYVSRTGEPDEMTGTHLGEFTNELDDQQFIREFCSGGPKNYWYLCNDDKTECKVKGHSLNVEGKAQLNYQVLQQNTLDELCRPLDEKLSSIKPAKSYDAPKNILFTLNRRKRSISWSTTNAFFDLVPPSRTLTDTDSPRRIRSQTIIVVLLRCYAMTNWLNFYWISMRRIETLASSKKQSCGVRVRGTKKKTE